MAIKVKEESNNIIFEIVVSLSYENVEFVEIQESVIKFLFQ